MKQIFQFLGMLFLLLVILAFFLVPKFLREGRVQATQKACFGAQKVLLGAIEIYRMDHASQPITLDLLASGCQKLVEANVLKSPLNFEVSGLRDVPYPKDRLPCCEIQLLKVAADPSDYDLECTIHGSPARPATFAQLKERLHLDFWGSYAGR